MGLANLFSIKSDGIDELVGRASNQANAMVLLGKMLADAATNVSEHADEQVQHTNEVAAAVEQMSASIREIADNASRTAETADRMAELNRHGLDNMRELSGSVDHVAQLFQKVTGVMQQLRDSAAAMGRVVEVINEIAAQTKLLSMNASIEAAHAGQHGKGFAVVAQEVRALAEKTRSSTEEISAAIAHNQKVTDDIVDAIEAGQAAVARGVQQSGETTNTLGMVAENIETVAGMVQQIVAATEQQARTAEDISARIDSVAKLARDTLTSANSSAQASNDLARVASRLEGRVSAFGQEFFGLVPLENAIKMNKSFTLLVKYIGGVLGRKLYVRLGHDYADAIREAGEGRALVSYQTPSTYIEAHEKYGLEPLVVPLAKGEPFYRSAIVVREESGISEVAQLAGKRFAFGDKKSTGSKAMPESMLKQAGVRLDDLDDYGFLGSHDNVATAVLNEDYDAGGLMLSVAEKYVGRGLVILATSDNIPQFPICASPKLSNEARRKLTQALLNLKDERILRALGSHVTGFAPIEDRDYDGVRAMLENLRG